jgi:hypothetical protein
MAAVQHVSSGCDSHQVLWIQDTAAPIVVDNKWERQGHCVRQAHHLYEPPPDLELLVHERPSNDFDDVVIGYPVGHPVHHEWDDNPSSTHSAANDEFVRPFVFDYDRRDADSFPSLDGHNYCTWQDNVVRLLTSRHVHKWAFVSPTFASSPQDWSASDSLTAKRDDERQVTMLYMWCA